jgi:uncharacterized protein (TIGR02001 family)
MPRTVTGVTGSKGGCRVTKSVLSSVVAISMPGAAAYAQEIPLSFGAAVVSEYVSDGIRYSDGVAFQPYMELGFGGAYAGAYTTNVDPDLTGANRETGLSLGYRGEAGRFSYDVSVNYYIYDEAFDGFPVEDYAETIASGTFAVSESLYLTGEISIAPEYDQTGLSLRADYYTEVEGLSVNATFGRNDTNYGDWNYWSAGATYTVHDNWGLSLAYQDSSVDEEATGLLNSDGLFVASISFDFSLP